MAIAYSTQSTSAETTTRRTTAATDFIVPLVFLAGTLGKLHSYDRVGKKSKDFL
jgi:hypothetical protein